MRICEMVKMKTTKEISAIIIVPTLACGATASVKAIRTKEGQRLFLSDLRKVQLGPVGYGQILSLENRFHRNAVASSKPCSRGECALTVSFENMWLRKPGCQKQAKHSSDNRKQSAFSQQLANHATLARAERSSNRKFAGTSHGTKEKQISHVHAGDEQGECSST